MDPTDWIVILCLTVAACAAAFVKLHMTEPAKPSEFEVWKKFHKPGARFQAGPIRGADSAQVARVIRLDEKRRK